MSELRLHPPSLGLRLLDCVCRPRYRDIVEGDLLELFALRTRSRGRPYASLRYLADVASLTRTVYSRSRRQRNSTDEPRRGLPTEIVMTLFQDLRHAARSLIKTPAFSLVVVLTLGLAIGANSAIFSVVDGVLLKPLPFDDPGDIVLVNERMPEAGMGGGPAGASQRLFLAWRERGQAFDRLAMYSNQASTLTSLAEPVRLNGAAVSPSLFPLLRVDAQHGRTFGADEELPGADDVVLLAHRTLQRLFGGDAAVMGQRIELDSTPRTVLGVMPSGFGFPDAGAEYWVPMLATPPEGLGEDASASAARQSQSVRQTRETRRGPGGGGGSSEGQGGPDRPGPGGPGGDGPEEHMELFARVVGRLAAGVTPTMAAEEGTRIARGLNEGDTEASQRTVEVTSMQEQMVGSVRRSLFTLLGAVGFVLLIACANVANLVMARSVERRKETAVRAALGAGWWSLARLLFLESLLLAGAGAILGLGLAWMGIRTLAGAGPEFIPRLEAVALDARALLFTLAVTGLTAILFSVVPARRARRLELTSALKEEFGSQGLTAGLGRDALRKGLVTVELAASVVLLVGAGLLVASFLRLTSVDMGYDVDNLVSVQIQLPASAYPDAASHLDYYDRLVAQFEGLQGVEAATVTSRPPNLPANIRSPSRCRPARRRRPTIVRPSRSACAWSRTDTSTPCAPGRLRGASSIATTGPRPSQWRCSASRGRVPCSVTPIRSDSSSTSSAVRSWRSSGLPATFAWQASTRRHSPTSSSRTGKRPIAWCPCFSARPRSSCARVRRRLASCPRFARRCGRSTPGSSC